VSDVVLVIKRVEAAGMGERLREVASYELNAEFRNRLARVIMLGGGEIVADDEGNERLYVDEFRAADAVIALLADFTTVIPARSVSGQSQEESSR